MGFWTHSNPTLNESLATSQGLIQSNFTMIQGVLGSSTLSAGISIVQGDILYGAAPQYIQRLAKSTVSCMATNFGSGNNISWVPMSSITELNGLKSAIALEAIGTIKAGVWSATTIGVAYGGTGLTMLKQGVSGAISAGDNTITFGGTNFANASYALVVYPCRADGGIVGGVIKSKAVDGFVWTAAGGTHDSLNYVAIGTSA